MKIFKKIILFAAVMLMFAPAMVFASGSAEFAFGSQTTTVNLNDSFVLDLYILPNGEQIDTARAILDFSPEYLELQSFSLGSSLTNVSPGNYFDNNLGIASFGGFNIGKKITDKSLFGSITFKAKKEGSSQVKINLSSKLIDNGQEKINIKNLSFSDIIIVSPKKVEEEKNIIKVSSKTHPDQNVWYNLNDIELTWDTNKKAQKIFYELNNEPVFDPKKEYSVENKIIKFSDKADGIWYFHIKALLEGNVYTNTANFQIKIDTVKPLDFEPYVSNKNVAANENTDLLFGTTDKTSGVLYYEISFDNKNWEKIESPFVLENKKPGEYKYYIRAVDGAGNITYGKEPVVLNVLETKKAGGLSFCFLQMFGIDYCCLHPYICILIFILLICVAVVVLYFMFRNSKKKNTKNNKAINYYKNIWKK